MVEFTIMRTGLPGGGRYALTTSPIAIDLSVFTGYTVLLFCDEQDINYSFADNGNSTTLLGGNQAGTLTGLVSKPLGAGTKMERIVGRSPFVVVATQASTGTLVVELVRKAV